MLRGHPGPGTCPGSPGLAFRAGPGVCTQSTRVMVSFWPRPGGRTGDTTWCCRRRRPPSREAGACGCEARLRWPAHVSPALLRPDRHQRSLPDPGRRAPGQAPVPSTHPLAAGPGIKGPCCLVRGRGGHLCGVSRSLSLLPSAPPSALLPVGPGNTSCTQKPILASPFETRRPGSPSPRRLAPSGPSCPLLCRLWPRQKGPRGCWGSAAAPTPAAVLPVPGAGDLRPAPGGGLLVLLPVAPGLPSLHTAMPGQGLPLNSEVTGSWAQRQGRRNALRHPRARTSSPCLWSSPPKSAVSPS